MIKTYVRVELGSEGESPKQVIERMRRIGAVPVVGDYDFELSLDDDERLFDKLEEIHHALKGSNVRYSLTTRTDAEAASIAQSRHEVTHYVDLKPIELKKSLYKAKLERWRDMGLDVSELEGLLEKDLDQFKAASKDFLRTHLDKLSVVKDKKPESHVDGQLLARLDERGRTIAELVSATGFSDVEVTLSLGRLISSGSAQRVQRDSIEVYCLVPPPAPTVRKALKFLRAENEAEAEQRVLDSIPAEGISAKELVKAAMLPRDQLAKAISSLTGAGKLKTERSGNKEVYLRA